MKNEQICKEKKTERDTMKKKFVEKRHTHTHHTTKRKMHEMKRNEIQHVTMIPISPLDKQT